MTPTTRLLLLAALLPLTGCPLGTEDADDAGHDGDDAAVDAVGDTATDALGDAATDTATDTATDAVGDGATDGDGGPLDGGALDGGGAPCGPGECGPTVGADYLCFDGSMPSLDCARDAAGLCGWRTGPCDRIGCHGDADCPGGRACNAATECASDPNCPACDVCWGWCTEPVAACTDEECGPAPGMPCQECDDGTVACPECGRDAEGACGWRFNACP